MSATVLSKYESVKFMMPEPIQSEAQNEAYTKTLLALDRRGDDLSEEEEKYAQVLSILIRDFEEKHYQIPDSSPVDVIKELMSANDLKQADLVPIFGAKSIVSEILSGSRPLSKNHIAKLAERFHISPAAFF